MIMAEEEVVVVGSEGGGATEEVDKVEDLELDATDEEEDLGGA